MFKLKHITFLIFLILISSQLFAQSKYHKNDRSYTNNWDDWDDFEFWDWEFDSRPMIEINYGTSLFEHKNFNGDFSDNGITEFKIGYSSLDRNRHSLAYLQENYLIFSKVSPALKSSIDRVYDYKTELLRGGVGWRNGVGYTIGNFSIIPYNQTGILWTKLDKNDFPSEISSNLSYSEIQDGLEIINRYEDNYRFSVAQGAGIKMEIGPMIAFNGGYEVNTIFPRVKTWELMGTYVIEYAALGVLNEFLEEIEFSTPEAAPFVNLILKSALHYTFYQLRQEDMNWPFSSEKPLTFESFKAGVTFTF